MDPTPVGGLAHMEQYGALGIIAAALLGMVILLVRQFVQHAIKSNEQLQAQNVEMQKENLRAMHAIVTEIAGLRSDMAYDLAAILNSSDRTVGGERSPRERRPTRPPINPRGGSGTGG